MVIHSIIEMQVCGNTWYYQSNRWWCSGDYYRLVGALYSLGWVPQPVMVPQPHMLTLNVPLDHSEL